MAKKIVFAKIAKIAGPVTLIIRIYGDVEMTDKEIYKEELSKVFADQRHSLESTIIWIYTHHEKLPIRFVNARRELDDYERNQIIREIC